LMHQTNGRKQVKISGQVVRRLSLVARRPRMPARRYVNTRNKNMKYKLIKKINVNHNQCCHVVK